MKLARRDSTLLEKMKCIFSIASEEVSEKSHECFTLRNTRHTLGQIASDAEPVSDEYTAERCKFNRASERLMLSL